MTVTIVRVGLPARVVAVATGTSPDVRRVAKREPTLVVRQVGRKI